MALLNHLQLLMDRAITYSWPGMRNFHLSVHNAVEQGRLTWHSADIIRERSQTFFSHLDLRSNSAPSRSFNATSQPRNKAKDHLCKEWNYSGKCSCSITDASYKTVHKCRVCDSPMCLRLCLSTCRLIQHLDYARLFLFPMR